MPPKNIDSSKRDWVRNELGVLMSNEDMKNIDMPPSNYMDGNLDNAGVRKQRANLEGINKSQRENNQALRDFTDDLSYLGRLVELPDRKVSMIRGSGADLSLYKSTPLPTGTPLVLLPARLLVDKGVREFVQSAKILRQRGLSEQDVRFVIVGKTDPANPHSLHQDELALWAEEGIVELWGHRTDMPKVMAAAKIVVLPSYYGEGLPKVLIEAAACGRAVITTDHTGCRDAIKPGVTGILVPVRNELALANAIQDLLADSVRCAIMGQAGRELAVSKFDERQVVSAHLKIYKDQYPF